MAAYAESAPNMIPAYDANETLHPWERDPKEDWRVKMPQQILSRTQRKGGKNSSSMYGIEAAASLEASEQPEGHDQKRSEENENHGGRRH